MPPLPTAVLRSLMDDLFGFTRPESPGERVHLQLFELLTVVWALSVVWLGSVHLASQAPPARSVGIATWLDLRFMFTPGAAYVDAALVSVALAFGVAARHRPAYLVALLGGSLQLAACGLAGDVAPGSDLLGVAVLGLALGALIHVDLLDARRFAFGLTVAAIALGHTSMAVYELVQSGRGWAASHPLVMCAHTRNIDELVSGAERVLAVLQDRVCGTPWLERAVLSFGLAAELGALLGVARALRPWLFGVLAALCARDALAIGIPFGADLSLVLVVGLPWQCWLARTTWLRAEQEQLRRAGPA